MKSKNIQNAKLLWAIITAVPIVVISVVALNVIWPEPSHQSLSKQELRQALLTRRDVGTDFAETNGGAEDVQIRFDEVTGRSHRCTDALSVVEAVDENIFFGSAFGTGSDTSRAFESADFALIVHSVVMDAEWLVDAYRSIVENCNSIKVKSSGPGTLEGIELQAIDLGVELQGFAFAEVDRYPKIENRHFWQIWSRDGVTSFIMLSGSVDSRGNYTDPSIDRLRSLTKRADQKLVNLLNEE